MTVATPEAVSMGVMPRRPTPKVLKPGRPRPMLDEITFDAPYTPCPTTLLYGLALRGRGTGEVESFSSYLHSLADAHSTSLKSLVRFLTEAPELAEPRGATGQIQRRVLDTDGRRVLTPGIVAEGWVRVVGAAT